MRRSFKAVGAGVIFLAVFAGPIAADTVKIGLNYPVSGPYSTFGVSQLQAAKMTVDEINASGGILGKQVELVIRDSETKDEKSKLNVEELIDKENCQMVFGGISSGVQIAGGKAAKSRGKIYFAPHSYSNETTRQEAHKYIFRENPSSWMSAVALSSYLREHFARKKYFYITADYTWGRTTEDSLRKFSNTTNKRFHKSALTPFPQTTVQDIETALDAAESANPDVLIVIMAGKGMTQLLKMAGERGLKKKMAFVAPVLTLDAVRGPGPEIMEGVIGASPWCWKLPFIENYEPGKKFVTGFSAKYNSYPSSAAASVYTILYEYKRAVERANTFETRPVVRALEGHKFTSLKDEQMWRDFDHQCIQTVYTLKCKPAAEVLKDPFKEDYFEIIHKVSGDHLAIDRYGWENSRTKAGLPAELQWE